MNSIQPLLNRSTRSDLRCFQPHRMGPALQGWKNIASYLNRGVRTVQRWERDLGLSVHRIGKGPRSAVFAFTEELQAWLRNTCDLHACADFSAASDSLLGQERSARIANRVRKAKLVEDGLRNPGVRKTPKGRNLQAIINFLAAASSTQPPGDCDQCHSPLRMVDGYFRVSETERNLIITVSFCPVCDQEPLAA